ncbi:SdrH family protein [Staphylococcus cohnii]|uniref:SdrH family protein n=1 Tax=Staphylococcus cohnii TaxID=29382 RepID=UPI003AC8946F
MKGYKMNKILVSSFAFAISASLLSKPIQAAEDQNNNISTDTKDDFAGTDDMGRSNFVPSISDLYSIDGKENFDTNIENNNTIKNELSADKLNSGEKEKSVDDDVFNNEGTDTPVQPDEDTSGSNEDANTGGPSTPDEPNEDDNTGEPSTPDQPNEDESTPSEPDNPSDGDTSDSSEGDNSGANEGTDEPSDGDTSDSSEDTNTGESSTPDQPSEDESTPSEPDNPSNDDTSDSNDGDNSGTNDGTDEPTTPDRPDEGGGTPPKPDKPSNGDNTDTNEGTDEPTTPDRPNEGGGTPPKPDKPSNGDNTDTNEGTDEPTNPGRPNGGGGTPPKPDKPSNGDNTDTNEGTDEPTNPGRPNEGGGTPPKPDKPSIGDTSGSNGGTGVPTNPDRPNLTPPQSHYPNKPSNGNHRSVNDDAYQPTQPVKPSNPTRPNLKRPSENTQQNKYQNEINYGDLSVKQDTSQTSSSTNSDRQILNRFNQMSTGSFKYNPFVVNQVKQLNNGEQKISNRDILSILRPQRFDDNAFLNELQKGTNYFKFQYFNPLKSQDYYQNLDNQVLALITGEIGSMPDLKNPKTESASGKYEYHSSSDEEMTETADKNSKNTIDIKFERTLFALITAIFIIFIGVVVGYFVHRKNKNNE